MWEDWTQFLEADTREAYSSDIDTAFCQKYALKPGGKSDRAFIDELGKREYL